ncbi:MAG TPA: ribonuclease R [Nevskiaceae bacterium]|nr:ribonuclease R [Nevskiaceae bacterium]
MKKRSGRGSPPKPAPPRASALPAAVSASAVRSWLAAHDSAQSLDDLVVGLGLLRLHEQEALIHELVELHGHGAVVLDRRGRYRLASSAPAPAASHAAARTERKPARHQRTPAPAPAPAADVPVAVDSGSGVALEMGSEPVRVGATVEGIVSIRGDGYGFVVLPATQRAAGDVFVPARQLPGVLDGDRLRVRVTAIDERGRLEGRLLEVVAPGRRTLVGRLHIDGASAWLLPSDPHQPDLPIAEGGRGDARQGQVVVAEILRGADRRTTPQARVVEVLGDHLAAGIEIEAAIREHELPHVFTAAAVAEAAAFGAQVPQAEVAARHDLRDLPLVTIDGADARDFDDAVCARPTRGGGWTLWVAIADVSAYVTPGSALDAAARERGTSVYFPERVVPMLPEALSNGLCSLNPDVDRLCMVCEMRVDASGATRRARFYAAVMRSHARLVYEQVAALLADPEAAPLARRHPALVEPLQALDAVYGALLKARTARGAIDFESTETRIVFDANRKIESIQPVQRTRAHRLIEECMIAANVEAAKFVGLHAVPAPFRVHAPPAAEKVAELREFLKLRGLSLGGGPVLGAADYARVVAELGERPDAGLIQQTLLRSLMQARYAASDDGHFGLALEHYAHFTSPIRRYPDLLLHRAIKHALARRRVATAPYSPEQMAELAQHCSMTERRADEATRDVLSWLKCEYMSHRVGECFDGVVTGVTSFGIFVELEGVYVDGMVHISQLGRDYFEYDARARRIVGSRSGAVFAMGTRVRVKLVRVSLDERKLDLELVTGASNGRRARR